MSPSFSLQIDSAKGSRALAVAPGDAALPLSSLAAKAGLVLNTRCAGRGLCNGCLVELLEGTLAHLRSEARVEAGNAPLSLQACDYRVDSPLVRIAVPSRSFLAHQPQIVGGFKLKVPSAHQPLVKGGGLGVALDIGTTTVVAALVDLETGEIQRQASDFNQQIRFGDNVLTRIALCLTDTANVAVLQRALLHETLVPLVCQLMEGMDRPLCCITAAGNTTMQHLLAGIDPSSMGSVPFTPAFLEHRVMRFEEAFGDIPVHLLPSAAAYVGADIVAGVLSSGMLYEEEAALLVDIGTNGEIVLKNGARFIGCATAAGPAFEGAGLSCGMRGVAGAIERIHIRREPWAVKWSQINAGKQPPAGICGSGYVDFLAEARNAGVLGTSGRFEDLPGVALGRDAYGLRSIFLVPDAPPEDGIFITEADIAQLLQAKAAIAAGILTLLEREGMVPGDVKRLYLAGGFGMHLNVEHTIRCGLLAGFKPEQIEVIGNSSLGGSYLALVDSGAMEELQRMAGIIETIELNMEPSFENHYLDQLSLE